MGAMKRLVGWQQARWPIPQPLAAFAGLEPFRPTAEELADRKAAAAEAKAEREAIQAEARAAAPPPAIPARPEIVLPDVSIDDPELGDELPVRAAPGWYRYGRTFYRVGSGPVAGWGFPTPRREPARTVQRTLF
jgi:hypothetical protein